MIHIPASTTGPTAARWRLAAARKSSNVERDPNKALVSVKSTVGFAGEPVRLSGEAAAAVKAAAGEEAAVFNSRSKV